MLRGTISTYAAEHGFNESLLEDFTAFFMHFFEQSQEISWDNLGIAGSSLDETGLATY